MVDISDDLSQASEAAIFSCLCKADIINSAEGAKNRAVSARLERGLCGELRDKIRDTYNTTAWLVVQGLSLATNAVGLGYFAHQAVKADAAAAQAAVTAAQLASSMFQPVTGYFTNRDQAGREEMQSNKQTATTNRDHNQQEASSAQQAIEQKQQLLRELRNKDGQTFSEMCR